MTPAARVQAAIELLDRILAGAPAEAELTRWARASRYAGSKDRRAVRDHVFDALRCRRSFAALGGAETGRGIMLGAIRANGIVPEDVFTGLGHAPAPLESSERAAPALRMDDLPHDLPDWLVMEFRASLEDEALAAMLALRARAPVMLRVNEQLKSSAQAIEILREDGIEAERALIAPTALSVHSGAARIAGSRAYAQGIVELQDGSSQAAMRELVDLFQANGKAPNVLDYCAGGGGKVLALAAQAQGRWFAHDADAGRMGDLPERAARAGAIIDVLPPGDAAHAAPYDLVLCDVPCSGSGTWRRTPDAKWKLTPERLSELVELQSKILGEAAGLLHPGGWLAYTTCSVLAQENDGQISRFLSKTPEWREVHRRHWPIGPEGDGFFLSCLARSG
ncbi:MAG: RsmB/NOP family class I SAM-dependent RNA methyltransferase [Roseovarius sp.]